MKFRAHIPNLFTLGNLICGSIATVHIVQSYDATGAVFLIFFAAFLDLLDGAIARKLNVSGELGKQLDSLADVVSFGVAPTVIIYKMLEISLPYDLQWVKYIAFLNAACAAMRLAKFNISTDQKNDFSGMPSPANGIFWASILSIYAWYSIYPNGNFLILNTLPLSFTLTMLFATSFLMVSNVRMFSFKFKPGGFKENQIPYLFIIMVLIIAGICMVRYHNLLLSVPLCIILYIMLSFVYNYMYPKNSEN
jgi:CDP-diacylglycerol---serine O-phosphatidyltransferase